MTPDIFKESEGPLQKETKDSKKINQAFILIKASTEANLATKCLRNCKEGAINLDGWNKLCFNVTKKKKSIFFLPL